MANIQLVGPVEAAEMMFKSGKINRMGPKNLRARGAETIDGYAIQYRNGLYDWSEVPSPIRQRAVRLMAEGKAACKRSGFDSLGGMSWRMALSRDTVENGWPHTVGDVMVIPLAALESRTDADVVRLLVHEATHVAQRKDPMGAREYVTKRLGFEPTDGDEVRHLPEARVNPDTDDIVYKRKGRICHPVFYGIPSTLADIKLQPDINHPDFDDIASNHEHPYEIMAEIVAAAVEP